MATRWQKLPESHFQTPTLLPFQSFWIRVQIRNKNAESCRSRLQHSGSVPESTPALQIRGHLCKKVVCFKLETLFDQKGTTASVACMLLTDHVHERRRWLWTWEQPPACNPHQISVVLSAQIPPWWRRVPVAVWYPVLVQGNFTCRATVFCPCPASFWRQCQWFHFYLQAGLRSRR